MTKTVFLLTLILLGMVACQESPQVQSHISQNKDNTMSIRGKSLFTEKCIRCHNIGSRDGFNMHFWNQIPLKSNPEKLRWIQAYISNSDSLAQSGDTYAIALKAEYNNEKSHNFNLSKEEVG